VKRIGLQVADLVSVSPLIMAVIVGLLLIVVEFGIFMRIPLVVLLYLYIFWITSNYFLEIVEYRALGNTSWPVFSLDTLVARRSQAGVVFSLIVTAVAAACAMLRYFEFSGAAEILLVVALAAFPAAAATLAVTRRFGEALNPFKVVAVTAAMGGGYLLCLPGAAGVYALLGVTRARGGLWYFPLVYGLFLFAYLIGSVVYVRRSALGVHAPRSPEARAQRESERTLAIRRGILNHAYGFATHGNLRGALKHIESYLATDEDTLEARLWMLQEVAGWDVRLLTREFGKRVLDYCDANGFVAEAAKVRAISERE